MITAIKKILLIDDEERLLNSMAQRLALLGFEAIKATSGTMAIEIASKTKIDLAIVDLKMPDMDGLVTITRLKELLPDLKTVLLTGYGSKEIKAETRELGAEYFEKDAMNDLWDLIKQFNTQDNVIVINPASSDAAFQSRSENPDLKKNFGQGVARQNPGGNLDSIGRSFGDLPKIIGETPGMQRLRKEIERLSDLDCSVIIQGETGTGKELAARAIHVLSHRKNQRFLAFNCGCFSTDFQFTELLGSLEEPMSGVGSKHSEIREPRFIGTILLDHFETMPGQTQQELIKIFDEIDANRSPDAVETLKDIRFIVATHQDLQKKVEEKKFNQNLYRRLNAIVISMPSLRDRRDDISPLCSYFLNTLNKEFKKNIESVSDEVFSVFMSYPFPGNVRELKHIMERAVILAEGKTIEIRHLPERFSQKTFSSPVIENQEFPTLGELEKNHIIKAIELTKGNKSKAAEILGISRAALWRKLKLINTGE